MFILKLTPLKTIEQTLTIQSPAVATNSNQAFLKAWKTNHILANALGLALFHTLIAHGIAGSHGVSLTGYQFVMHTVSIVFFELLLNGLQNKALQHKFTRQTFTVAGYFVVLVPVAFWLGYYTLYIPFDIVFMYLTIGIFNAWRLKHYFADGKKWAWQKILALTVGAMVGVACGFGAYFGFIKIYYWFRGRYTSVDFYQYSRKFHLRYYQSAISQKTVAVRLSNV